LRTIIISWGPGKYLSFVTWIMVRFNSDHLRQVAKDAQLGDTEVAQLVDNIDFLTSKNLEGSVKQEVKYMQEHPRDTTVRGWIYDVGNGE
jgi:carbonic anhydrase